MDDRKSTRRDDDVPIIGDYSDAQNARLRPAAPAPPRAEPAEPPARAPRRDGPPRDDRLLIDPSDMQRHARLARQRDRKPGGKLRAYAAIVIAVGVAGLVYWNFDTLRGITFDFSQITSLIGDHDSAAGTAPRAGGGIETAPVESQAVAGTAVATSLGDAPPPSPPPPAGGEASASQEPPAEASPPVSAAVAAESDAEKPARVEPPPPPPEPESFEFGLAVNNVSEADPAAAVLILRVGDRRAASTVTWWTTPGTATAGTDYVDLGKGTVKFAPGEQNRTIRIPIIGDGVVEGPENFYVHLETAESAGRPAQEAQTEVVINDDD